MSYGKSRPLSRRDFLRMIGATGATLTASQMWAVQRLLAQDTPGSDVEATLTTYNWGSAGEVEEYGNAFARFNQSYPNVTVVDNITPITSWADFLDQLVINVASGNTPDMINIAIEGVQLAVSKGLLLPLDDFLASDPEGEAFLELIPQQLLDALSVDGTLYMMPNGWQTMVIHYNTDIFSSAGMDYPSSDWTWDDFLETAQALTNDDHYGFGVFWGNFQLHPWWLTNGSYAITEDASASNLNDPKFIEAVSFMNDLVNTHGVSPDPLGMNPADLFANGTFAMVPAGRWPIPGWKAAGFTSFDVVPWPQKETQDTVFGCAGWGISPESANPDLAWQAIKELISVETITAVMKLGHQIPPLRSVAEDPSFLEVPDNAELFFNVIDTTQPVASPPYFTDLERIQMRNLERVIIGDASPEEAMNEAHEELNVTIERFYS